MRALNACLAVVLLALPLSGGEMIRSPAELNAACRENRCNVPFELSGIVVIPPRESGIEPERTYWRIDRAILIPENTTVVLQNCKIKLSGIAKELETVKENIEVCTYLSKKPLDINDLLNLKTYKTNYLNHIYIT